MNTTNSGRWTAPVAFLSFIGLGMTSGLLGLAWPSMQKQFELPLDGVNILLLLSTLAYTLTSFFIGRLMAKLTSGVTLLLGVTAMVVCMFGIATSQTWLTVIAFMTLFGFGSGVIDAGLNMYTATYLTARQMNWLHACFGIGITVGPLIMTYVLQHELGWHSGYAIVGTLLSILIVMYIFTRRQWRNEGLQTHENKPVSRAKFIDSLRVPVLWLSMATFMAYVSVEIGIGQWAYVLLTQSRNIPTETAGIWVSIYWGSFTIGRIFFGLISDRFDIDRILRLCTFGAILGAMLFLWNPLPFIGLVSLVWLGFIQAPVFPLLMMGTAKRVGAEHAENSIGIQMSAIGIGSAILPGMIGTIGKNFGLEMMSVTFVVLAILVFVFHELARTRQTVTAPAQD